MGKKLTIAIIGMGYVGVPLGIEFANNGLKDIDLAYNYVNSLKDRLTNKCKLDTEIKSIIHDSQKFYLLSIK